MKKFHAIVFTTLFAALPLMAADVYKIDKQHSEAIFQVRHLVSKVSGKFDDFGGTISIDAKNPAASTVEFTMKTASINTGVSDRDNHLRSVEFFDAAKNPEITFKSTAIKATDKKNVYSVTGNLTMRGVTKTITIPVEFLGYVKDPWGNEKAGFATSTVLNRKDYGINWNKALDNGGVLLGDDVNISINIEAAKAKS